MNYRILMMGALMVGSIAQAHLKKGVNHAVINCYKELNNSQLAYSSDFSLVVTDEGVKFHDNQIRFPMKNGEYGNTFNLKMVAQSASQYTYTSKNKEEALTAFGTSAQQLVIDKSIIDEPYAINRQGRIERAALKNERSKKAAATYSCFPG